MDCVVRLFLHKHRLYYLLLPILPYTKQFYIEIGYIYSMGKMGSDKEIQPEINVLCFH